MKYFFEKWKRYVQEDKEGLQGNVTLYHFSRTNNPELLLDPRYFLAHRQHYTRNDYNVSDMPRIFFYTDLEQAEQQVKEGSTLYKVEVPSKFIYNLSEDPLKLKEKSISSYRVTPDYDRILRSLANKPRESKYGPPPESLLKQSKYKGAYYKTAGMNVVVWFEPIKVKKEQQ